MTRMTNMTIEEQIFACDPVKVAVQLFHGTERNRLLWGWYCRTMGRDRFRECVYQKHCENKEAGMPRNPAAAFQAMLSRMLPKRQNAAPSAAPSAAPQVATPVEPPPSAAPQVATPVEPPPNAAPQPQPAAMKVDPFGDVAKSFAQGSRPRTAEERQRDWERNKELQLHRFAEYCKANNLS